MRVKSGGCISGKTAHTSVEGLAKLASRGAHHHDGDIVIEPVPLNLPQELPDEQERPREVHRNGVVPPLQRQILHQDILRGPDPVIDHKDMDGPVSPNTLGHRPGHIGLLGHIGLHGHGSLGIPLENLLESLGHLIEVERNQGALL